MVSTNRPPLAQLVAELRDPDLKVCKNAAQRLWRYYPEQALAPLQELLHDDISRRRLYAVEALGKLGNRQALQSLLSVLGDESIRVRYRAIEALGQLHDGAAALALVGKLHDSSAEVRLAALRTLGSLGEPQVLPDLLALLEDDEEEQILCATIDALAQLGGDSVIETFLTLLARPESSMIIPVQEIVITLGKIATPRAIQTLLNIYHDQASLRYKVIFTLGQLDVRGTAQWDQAVDFLLERLEQESDSFVRAAILGSLGNMGDRRAVQPLLDLWSDPALASKPRLLEEVPLALAHLGDARAVEPLLQKLETYPGYVIPALGLLRDARALDPLIHLLHTYLDSSYDRIQLNIIHALGAMQDSRAEAALSPFLHHAQPIYQWAARQALDKINQTDPKHKGRGVPQKQERSKKIG